MHLKDNFVTKISELIYYGYWFSPELDLLRKTIEETQVHVTGTVRLKLYKGNCTVVGRKSEKSLYRGDFATFGEDVVYNQRDAEGFIRLNALRLRIRRLLGR
jgi:argininosuccinate synthase